MPGRKGRAAVGFLRLWPSQGDLGTDQQRPPGMRPFFFNDTATTEIYTVSDTLSLTTLFRSAHHHAGIEHMIPSELMAAKVKEAVAARRSEEHTSELQSPDTISYAVFCLK